MATFRKKQSTKTHKENDGAKESNSQEITP